MIAIIDYGAGNLKSIINACRLLGYETNLVSDPRDLKDADRIILPGVGNFGPALSALAPYKGVLLDAFADDTPILGICLGIQLFLEGSDESPGVDGLGLFKGHCLKLPSSVKIPHMGWNNVSFIRDTPLTAGLDDNSLFYFVHSFYPVPGEEIIVGETDYGIKFASIIGKGNVYATQFHPEKSGETGLRLLGNFLGL